MGYVLALLGGMLLGVVLDEFFGARVLRQLKEVETNIIGVLIARLENLK